MDAPQDGESGRLNDFITELMARHDPQVRRWLLRRLGHWTDVDDLCQVVWIKVFNQYREDKPPFENRPNAWFLTIADHACSDFMKSRGRRDELHKRLSGQSQDDSVRRKNGEAMLPAKPAVIDDSTKQACCEELVEALSKLSPNDRRLIEAHDFGGETWGEIAGWLGVTEKTAMAWRYKALGQLRELLGESDFFCFDDN